MPKRRKTRTRRKTPTKRRSTKSRTVKRKLVGYTKQGKKFKLVFRKGKAKPTLGTKSFGSKKTMLVAAKKALK